MGPQVVDLNKDGFRDLISGCWPGEICVFWGIGGGKFGKHESLKHVNGKPIKDESASSVAVVDWDKDGDTDLFVGYISGPLKYYANNGKNRFAAGATVYLNKREYESHDGGPCVADWDSDGHLDLIVGNGNGGLDVLYGTGGKGNIKFTRHESLLDSKSALAWQPRKWDESKLSLNPKKPGVRTKPAIADWNNDGRLDLLVGDFVTVETPAPTLTEEEKSKLAELEKEMQPLLKESSDHFQKIVAESYKAAGVSPGSKMTEAQNKKYLAKYVALTEENKRLSELQSLQRALQVQITKYKPDPTYTGVVWVYLRQ